MPVLIILIHAEEHEIASLRSPLYIRPFLVEVLDVGVGDAEDQPRTLAQRVGHVHLAPGICQPPLFRGGGVALAS
jgi:hypothetical protein